MNNIYYLVSAKYGGKLKIVLSESCPPKYKKWFERHGSTIGYWISSGKEAMDSLIIVDVAGEKIEIPWNCIKFCHVVRINNG